MGSLKSSHQENLPLAITLTIVNFGFESGMQTLTRSGKFRRLGSANGLALPLLCTSVVFLPALVFWRKWIISKYLITDRFLNPAYLELNSRGFFCSLFGLEDIVGSGTLVFPLLHSVLKKILRGAEIEPGFPLLLCTEHASFRFAYGDTYAI